jgi:hypothetical protein
MKEAHAKKIESFGPSPKIARAGPEDTRTKEKILEL